jgi:hypothetical protein
MIVPKSPFRRLKPKRRAERRVTICIGMLATNGLVIAADALESDNYFKRPVQKILTWNADNPSRTWPAACIIAGAGDGGFVDSFCSELIYGIRGDMSMDGFQGYAQKLLGTFYSEHVLPCLSVDPNHDFSVIIGASFQGLHRLLVSYKSTLRLHMGAAVAIGVGRQYAHRLLAQFGISDVRHMEIAAASVMFNTKDCIEGCGNATDIVALHGATIETDEVHGSVLKPSRPVWSRVHPEQISRWEDSFESEWTQRQQFLYRQLMQDEIKTDDELIRAKLLDSQTSEDQQ